MNNLSLCFDWYIADRVEKTSPDVSETRDIFQARLDKFFNELTKSKLKEQDSALLVAIAGEIGNNSFDHNLGQWRDVPGCWFTYDISDKFVQSCICDRGNGILATLQMVENLKDDQSAIEVAFQKRISGRAPERRGNGLKFVKSIINENANRGLFCRSGSGIFKAGGLKDKFEEIEKNFKTKIGKGVFTFINWEIHK